MRTDQRSKGLCSQNHQNRRRRDSYKGFHIYNKKILVINKLGGRRIQKPEKDKTPEYCLCAQTLH